MVDAPVRLDASPPVSPLFVGSGQKIKVNGVEILIESIQPGDATNFPQLGHTVRIHYVATLTDGTQFDSSRARDQPVFFKLDSGSVIAGLEAGVRTLSRGTIAKITIPPEAGFGEQGFPPIVAPNAVLIYEVKTISRDGCVKLWSAARLAPNALMCLFLPGGAHIV